MEEIPEKKSCFVSLKQKCEYYTVPFCIARPSTMWLKPKLILGKYGGIAPSKQKYWHNQNIPLTQLKSWLNLMDFSTILNAG